MYLTLFVVLLVVWLLGRFAFRIASGFIHIVLIIAVIALVVHFLGRAGSKSGWRRAPPGTATVVINRGASDVPGGDALESATTPSPEEVKAA